MTFKKITYDEISIFIKNNNLIDIYINEIYKNFTGCFNKNNELVGIFWISKQLMY